MNAIEFIKSKGGCAELARTLTELTGEYYSRQRVWYWRKAGIVPKLVLKYPKFFKGYVVE